MFWIIASLAGLAVVAFLVRPLLAGSRDNATDAAYDMQVYKDQLAEIEQDLARGVLSPDEADATRTEVSRRLLAAADAEARQIRDHAAPKAASRALVAGLAATCLAGGGALYLVQGSPHLPDQPLKTRLAAQDAAFAARPDQAKAEAEYLRIRTETPPPNDEHMALIDQLRAVLEGRPDDVQGHRLLARNLGQLGQWADAHAAQAKLLALLGEQATGADHVDHAEYQILATGGYVSPEAEAALERGLTLEPENPKGRYYSGLLLAQAGRPDLTYSLWSRLAAEGPENAPWVQAINAQLPDVARAAGIQPGPGVADIAAASEMSPEDRQEMIRDMVSGLAERLNTEGGPPQDWARLIRAYGVLGELRLASNVWNEARTVFADAPDALALIRQAARDAEVAQ